MLGELVSLLCLLAGSLFFLAGTVGMLRFPDAFMRLHALTKADNLGLGFIILGLALRAPGWTEVVKLACVWALALVASASVSHLVARAALHAGRRPWRRP